MSADPNSYVVLKRKEISPAYEVVSVLVKPGTDLEVIRSLVERTCEGICDIYMYDSASADQLVGFTNFDVGGVVRSPNRGL
jgi:ferredoxin-fold anticodon binding domain-containing protein